MDLKTYLTGPLSVNTYVLKDEESKEAVIIDVGGSFTRIKSDVENEGFKIKYILNTHGHFDHVAGEIEIRKNYPDIPVYIHKDDLPHIETLALRLNEFGFDSPAEKLVLKDFIDENYELTIGDKRIEIFHTPGHSKGSLSYYVDSKIFTGDTLFYRSIGRTDFFDGDFDTLIYSIKSKILTLPDDTVVYPGHGDFTSIRAEKNFNLYLR